MDVVPVKVLFFSALREAVGVASLPLDLPVSATGTDLLDALCRRYPVMVPYRPAVRLAVNQTYVPDQTPLAAGDEVALITPVSGG